ncbi:MAG: M20/M25/M40 family metallo-hydrolase [Planctomycetota bacterium]
MPALRSILAVSFSLIALVARAAQELPEVTALRLRQHVDFLASDALEGRDSGHRGAEVAAQYIATQFAGLGLKPLLDCWLQPFDLPGAANHAQASLAIAEAKLAGAGLFLVPAFAAAGKVTARVVAADGEVGGSVVVVDGASKANARAQAEQLFLRGAVAVLLVADQDQLEPEVDADFRRLGGSAAALPKGMKGIKGMTSLEDLPEDLKRAVAEQLAAMGIGGGNGRVTIRTDDGAAAADDVMKLLGGNDAEHGDRLVTSISPGMDLLGTRRLSGPVVWVSAALADQLASAIDSTDDVSVSVMRDGVDSSANVLAIAEGSDPVLRGEYVVLGAHYDHVGMDDEGHIWNGADDNASGTSGLLAIAEAVQRMPVKPKRSIVFAAWSGEERGLVGSSAFGKHPPVPMDHIAAYLNLDMISRNAPDSIDVLAASDDLRSLAFAKAAQHGFKPRDGESFYLNASDTAPFVRQRVPSLFFFSGTHPDYHHASDDADKIDAGKAARVAQATLEVLVEVANRSERPAFKEPAMAQLFGGGPHRGKLLGITPDLEASGDGVVTRASPTTRWARARSCRSAIASCASAIRRSRTSPSCAPRSTRRRRRSRFRSRWCEP